MKSFMNYVLIAFLCLFVHCSSSEGSQFQLVQSSDRIPTADINHTIIDLRFDWTERQAYGTATINLSTIYSTDEITLDAGMLTINSIKTVDGDPLEFTYDGSDKNDALVISLSKVYTADERLTIVIDYRTQWINESDPNNIWGSFGKGIRFFESTPTEKRRRRQIWSAGEPESNRYWVPGIDSPGDLRTTEFIATVEKPLEVISNGVLVSSLDNGDGTKTFHWKEETPHPSHLTSFVIGEYRDYKQAYKNITLHNYGYPDEWEGTVASVVRLPDMVKYFSESTGVEFPHKNYSQIFVQDFGGWMGNMGTSTITENMVDDKGTHDDFFYLWDITEGEALAQQWFGSYLFCKQWSDVWLNKAFSRYFSGLYDEHKNGTDEFLIYHLSPDQNTYLSDWNSGVREPVVNSSYEDAFTFVNGNDPYFHGSAVLHMLRKHLGDEKWWQVIKEYVRKNANQLVTTQNFIEVVNEVSGEDMNWFFDQWVFGVGHPIFEVSQTYNTSKQQLRLSVKQVQQPDKESKYPQTKYFRGKVNIEIENQIREILLEPRLENVYTFQLSEEPKLIQFDYESAWLKELKFKKTFDELLYQLQNDKDVMGRISAINELVSVASDSLASQETKSKFFSGLRNVVQSNQYWRMRLIALWQLQSMMVPNSSVSTTLDNATTEMLLSMIANERSWLKSNAINFLGMTREMKYTDIYLEALKDSSDRVVNMAAVALGRTKSPKAFAALMELKDKPSWKNQSLISTLNGLRELKDPRAFDLAIKSLTDSESAHWTLGTPIWDHRLAAAQTLVALGRTEEGYNLILKQFEAAMEAAEINDIFYNALQITLLADPRGQDAFDEMKERFKDDKNAVAAIQNLESQFKNALGK